MVSRGHTTVPCYGASPRRAPGRTIVQSSELARTAASALRFCLSTPPRDASSMRAWAREVAAWATRVAAWATRVAT